MNRTLVFGAAILAGIVCLLLMVLYWTGTLGGNIDAPFGLHFHHFKHGVLFLALAVVALLFAAATRPTART